MALELFGALRHRKRSAS